jgi:hypothetical protein
MKLMDALRPHSSVELTQPVDELEASPLLVS